MRLYTILYHPCLDKGPHKRPKWHWSDKACPLPIRFTGQKWCWETSPKFVERCLWVLHGPTVWPKFNPSHNPKIQTSRKWTLACRGYGVPCNSCGCLDVSCNHEISPDSDTGPNFREVAVDSLLGWTMRLIGRCESPTCNGLMKIIASKMETICLVHPGSVVDVLTPTCVGIHAIYLVDFEF